MKNNFLVTSNPKTNKECCYFFKEWRISILKNNIIRLEKSDKYFNELPTQIVVNRYFEKPNFTLEEDKNSIKFIFNSYTFIFNGNLETSYIIYNNEKLLLNNDYNLGGTYSTVDGMDGERYVYQGDKGIIREIGLSVCSKNGIAIIDDSNSYCFDENWEFSHINTDEVDVYIFFYPNDYQNAVKDYFQLSGYPPKLPKYVFGNWWSRYYAYTDKKYLRLMDEFFEENIPFTIATIDMDWHYSSSNGRNIFSDLDISRDQFLLDNKYVCEGWEDKNHMSLGWTGFVWNKKLFPDYQWFLKKLKDKNLHITLNLHPHDGIAFYETEFYQQFSERLNIDISKKNNIPFDLTDKDNRDLYFEKIFNKYEDEGVDFWWIDWQQGENSKFKGLTPMWLCNHYFYLNNSRKNQRPLILSRYCGIGGHRYPLGFSGDTVQTYDSLRYLVKTTSKATNIGFTYWSHDVGGHMMGIKDGEQFLKFVQFAVFSPILRLHCSCEEVYDKNPRLFLNGYGELIKKYLRLRHQLIPYIYSFMLKTNKEGRGLLEPIYYYHSEDENAYRYADEEYYFASSLLVSPFTQPKDIDGYSKKEVYFPEGEFYDYKYGYKYKGNNVLTIHREIDDMPVFIRQGHFLILDNNKIGNDISNPKSISVITTSGEGKYTLLEDDDNELNLETTFINNKNRLSILITGDEKLYQKDREYKIKFLDIFDIEDINIKGATIEDFYIEDYLVICVKNIEFNKEVNINYNVKNNDNFNVCKHNLLVRLSYLDDNNLIRQEIYEKINKCLKLGDFKKVINKSKLKEINKNCLLEVINFVN